MLFRRRGILTERDVTDPRLLHSRREIILAAAAALVPAAPAAAAAGPAPSLQAARNQQLSLADRPSPFEEATRFNNFYEFGVGKDDPARLAHLLRPRPWTVQVDGLVHRPRRFDLEELLRLPLEERIYPLRCVEGWSMVIPWIGFPLSALLKRVEPTGGARYVEFTTLKDPSQFPAQRGGIFDQAGLDWPYLEGLRLDEALHPLTLLAVGMYGRPLPNQNGAPLRLVVPWKYGFKSGKSLVRIRLTAEQPRTSWTAAAPGEYGFYANVNPTVDHPRWSQATERRLGEPQDRRTLMFNGYADQVGALYAGMDLRRFY